MQKTVRKILRAVADCDPDYYDMYADENEACFAQLYLSRIRQHAEAAGIRPPATVLEAGCQAGRLVVPLAKQGFRVTGIDTSGFALRRARQHARRAGVTASFRRGDLIRVLEAGPAQRFDIVVCAEVVYLSPQYREMLRALAAAVRPGGLLCVSHRPKAYYLMEAIRLGDLDTARSIHQRSEGPFRDGAYYNWQTEEELRALYGALGLAWLGAYPIDRIAWLSGMSPARLTDAQREEWLRLELGMPGETETCARYVLVIAAQPHHGSTEAHGDTEDHGGAEHG